MQNAVKAFPQNATIKIAFAKNMLTICNHGELFTQEQYERSLKITTLHKASPGRALT